MNKFLLLILCLFPTYLVAQNLEIKGHVIDEKNGIALPALILL